MLHLVHNAPVYVYRTGELAGILHSAYAVTDDTDNALVAVVYFSGRPRVTIGLLRGACPLSTDLTVETDADEHMALSYWLSSIDALRSAIIPSTKSERSPFDMRLLCPAEADLTAAIQHLGAVAVAVTCSATADKIRDVLADRARLSADVNTILISLLDWRDAEQVCAKGHRYVIKDRLRVCAEQQRHHITCGAPKCTQRVPLLLLESIKENLPPPCPMLLTEAMRRAAALPG